MAQRSRGSGPCAAWRGGLALAWGLGLFAAAAPAAEEVFDARCFEEAARAERAKCQLEDPCRSDCWTSVFSHSYCCLEESPCWWWGRAAAAGGALRVEAARSGVECRYLCQAEPSCAAWTFHFPAAPSPDAPGPCALLSAAAAGPARPGDELVAGVVSGPRICAGPGPPKLLPPAASLDTAGQVFVVGSADYAGLAARALVDSGWAVLRGALSSGRVEALARSAAEEAQGILQRDPPRLGNRGPRRYSFGGASTTHHVLHREAWSDLADDAVLAEVLALAFGGAYVLGGGGGDFVLGGTDTHQRLHVDLQLEEMYDVPLPPAAITANVAVASIECDGGPVRLVPRTQGLPLAFAEEAMQGKDLTLASPLEREAAACARLGLQMLAICPMRPGDVLLRDMRVWHGGTPNRGSATRFLPSAEFLAPWYADLTVGSDDHFAPRPALPFASWLRMSDQGRAVSRRMLAAPGPVAWGIRPDFVLLLPYVAEDRP